MLQKINRFLFGKKEIIKFNQVSIDYLDYGVAQVKFEKPELIIGENGIEDQLKAELIFDLGDLEEEDEIY